MAKLLSTRMTWAAAGNAVQVHGGNGYAQECRVSRAMVDSRILNVFEGAVEIQAHIVERELLDEVVRLQDCAGSKASRRLRPWQSDSLPFNKRAVDFASVVRPCVTVCRESILTATG